MATKKHEPIPRYWPVRPIRSKTKRKSKSVMTCGHCKRAWDDNKVTSMTPVPSGRCPFESFHVYQTTFAISVSNADSAEAMAETLRRIAELLDEGYTSGYDPDWSSTEELT